MFGNGPLATVRSLPEKATRAPSRLSLSPPASTNSPASISAWLNAPMSAKSSAGGMPPTSESFVALTITMTRIVVLSDSSRTPLDVVELRIPVHPSPFRGRVQHHPQRRGIGRAARVLAGVGGLVRHLSR